MKSEELLEGNLETGTLRNRKNVVIGSLSAIKLPARSTPQELFASSSRLTALFSAQLDILAQKTYKPATAIIQGSNSIWRAISGSRPPQKRQNAAVETL